MLNLPIHNSTDHYGINPGKIICVGLNYHEHIAESLALEVQPLKKAAGKEVPSEPVLFPKTPNVLIPSGENIILPKIVHDYGFKEPRTDHEAELAVIIGQKCRNIREDQVSDVIYGYTCFNDVSQRNIQKGDRSGWFRGKSFDTFGPVGPCVVLKEDLPNVDQLDITCRVNGKEVQKSNTSLMIFSIPRIISFISRHMTLNPGDIIATGTPSGVSPLHPGDLVEVEIEGIGILRNSVEEER